MKLVSKLIGIVVLSILFAQCAKEPEQNVIKCEIEGLENGDKVILSLGTIGEKPECVDSIVYEGQDIFELETREKDVDANICIVPNGKEFSRESCTNRYVFLEGYSIIKVAGNATKGWGVKKKSDNLDKFFSELEKIKEAENKVIRWTREEVSPRYYKFGEQKNKSDSLKEELDKAFEVYDELNEQRDSIKIDFIEKYPDIAYSAYILHYMHNLKNEKKILDYEKLFFQLSNRVQKSRMGSTVAKNIAGIKATAIGSIAPEFAIEDINGKKINLSDYRGKHVFLEFWTTRCGACLQLLPNLKKIRKEISKDKLVMISIAGREYSEEKWREFVEKEQLDWIQALSKDKNVLRAYGINSYPKYFFIAPNGKIVDEYSFFKGIKGTD